MTDNLDLAALRAPTPLEKARAKANALGWPTEAAYAAFLETLPVDELVALSRDERDDVHTLELATRLTALDRRSQPDEGTVERMDRAYSDSINAALDSADGTQTMKEIRMAAARAAFAALHEREAGQ